MKNYYRILLPIIVLALCGAIAQRAPAASGTWTNDGGGNWSDTTKWLSTTVADGASSAANFSNNITANRTVTLNTSRSIGQINLVDATTGSHTWTIAASGGSILTLNNGANVPLINSATRTNFISAVLAGTSGMRKIGNQHLALSGANTYSGGTLLSSGIIFADNSAAFGYGPVTNTATRDTTRITLGAGVMITNLFVVAGNAGSPATGRGLIEGPSTGGTTSTWSGPLIFNYGQSNGGTFIGNGGTLVVAGQITAPTVAITVRAGRVVMAGGGTCSSFGIGQDTTLLGANDGVPSGVVMQVAASAAGAFDLNGFNQTLGGVFRNNTATITNSGPSASTLTLNIAAATNYTFTGFVGGNLGIVKNGGGRQSFTAANTYSGPTVVNAGRLELYGSAAGSGSLTVNDSGTLALYSTYPGGGAVAVNQGGTLDLTVPTAGTTLYTPSLAAGSTTEATNTLNLGSGNPTVPVIYATNLTVNGTIYVNITGVGLSVGQFTLIKYENQTGLTDSSFVTNTVPAGVVAYTSNNVGNSSIDLVVTQAPYIVWQGGTNDGVGLVLQSEWDINTTSNWFDPFAIAPAYYLDGLAVVIDDPAPGTNVLALVTNVSPSGVTFANTNRDFAIQVGTNAIIGAGRLTKEGPGLLTVGTANTYSGDTLINGGMFRLATNNVIPDGAGKGNVTLNGVLDIAGFAEGVNGITGSGLVTNSGPTGTTNVLTIGNNNGVGTLVGGVQEGAGSAAISLTKSGSGVITLGGSSFSGSLTVGGGTLALGGPATPSGAISLAGTLRTTSSVTNTGPVTLTAASVLSVDDGETAFLGGTYNGAFALQKQGDGTLILTNAGTINSFHVEKGTAILDGATMNNNAFVSIGRLQDNDGTLILKGNTVMSVPRDFNVADTANSVGRLYIQDSAQLLLTNLWLGKSSTSQGFVYQSGGSVTNPFGGTTEWRIAGNAVAASNTIGGYYMSGGQLDLRQNFQVGVYGTGELIITNGVVNSWAGWPVIGRFSGSTGLVVVAGGQFNQLSPANSLIVGQIGRGTLVVSNTGVVNLTNVLMMGGTVAVGPGTGVVTLAAGGLIACPGALKTTNTSHATFNLDGGTFQATTNNAAFLQGMDVANILNGGAVFDSAGWNITIAQDLLASGTGGLTKNGAGALTLSGVNTYTGPTVVNAGRLNLAPAVFAGGGAITLGDDTTLGVTLTAAGSSVTASSLTLGTSGAVTNEFNLGVMLGNPTVAPIQAGAMTVNGTVTINVPVGSLTVGQFPLIKYTTRSGAGSFNPIPGMLPKGVDAAVVDNVANSSIDLIVNTVYPLTWNGNYSADWDIDTTGNWLLNASEARYEQVTIPGDAVLFDDLALGNWDVNLTTALAPALVTVNNDLVDYSFNGVGKITGPSVVEKRGTAKLTITTTNDYTGLTTIAGGTVVLGTLSNATIAAASTALGATNAGTVITNGGTLDLNNYNIGTEQVVASGTGVDGNGALVNNTLTTTGGGHKLIQYLTMAGDLTVGGVGRFDLRESSGNALNARLDTGGQPHKLTKRGTNIFSIVGTAVDPALGDIDVLEGALGVENGTTLGNSASNLTFAAGAALRPYNLANPLAKKIVVNGGNNFQVGNGNNAISGPVTLNADTIVSFFGTGTLDFRGSIDGVGGLIKQATNVVFLTANNTYSGRTMVEGGTLQVGSDANFGTPPGSPTAEHIGLAASALRVTNSFTLDSNRGMALGTNGGTSMSILDIASGTLTYAGAIADAAGGVGGLVKASTGTLVLAGDSTFTGGVTNLAGTLQVGHDNALGTGLLSLRGGTVGTFGGARSLANAVSLASGTATLDTAAGDLTLLNAFVGETTGADMRKTGDNSLVIQGGLYFNNPVGWDIFRGYVAVDAASATNTGDGIRIDAEDGAVAGLIITNGGSYVLGSLTGNPNLRLGMTLNRTGTNVFAISSGEFVMDVTGVEIRVGDVGGTTGVVYQTGGTVKWRNSANASAGVVFVVSAGADGAYHLDGGTLITPRIRQANILGAGRFYFNGGTLSPFNSANAATFMQGLTLAEIQDGGAIIDSAGINFTIGQALLNGGTGGLTKNGLGTLTLTNVNTYIGNTLINAGTLALNGAGSVANSANIVLGGGAFDVSGVAGGFTLVSGQSLKGVGNVAGAVTVAPGATLAPGASLGTLAFDSTLDLAGETIMEINKDAAPNCDRVTGVTTLTCGGALTVLNDGAAPVGGEVFDLFDAGTITGAFSATNLPLLGTGLNWWTGNLGVDGSIIVNRAPLATNTNIGTLVNQPVTVEGSKLLLGCSDPDGNPLALVSASTSTNGANVTLSGGNIIYTPNSGFIGEDRFDYTISDGRGGLAMGTIVVTVIGGGEGFNRVAVENLGGGTVRLSFQGIPGFNYALDWATNLTAPIDWRAQITNTAATNGFLQFTNTSTEPANFYRTRNVP